MSASLVKQHLIRNGPALAVFIVMAMWAHFRWIDAALFPAVTVHHARTEVLNRYMHPQRVFKPGTEVLVRGYGRVNRSCARTYTRALQFPDGDRTELPRGRGTRFIPGEGGVIIVIETHETWPEGAYEYLSTGFHDCNPPFPPQQIAGLHAQFELRR